MSISKEKFKEMLKEKGLKVTNQRLLVLEVLADHRDRHMTAENIYELVKEEALVKKFDLRLFEFIDLRNLQSGALSYNFCRNIVFEQLFCSFDIFFV